MQEREEEKEVSVFLLYSLAGLQYMNRFLFTYSHFAYFRL